MFKKVNKKERVVLANILIFHFILYGIIFAEKYSNNFYRLWRTKSHAWRMSIILLTINVHITGYSNRAFTFSRTKPNPA